jgi:hypothetical protein
VRLSLGTITVALLVSLAAPSARQGTDQPPRLRSGVDVVRVEASVLDKNRRPARGLTADDFVVLENGRERPVAAFSAVDLPATQAREEDVAGWVDGAPRDVANNAGTDAGRLIVIVFDVPTARRVFARSDKVSVFLQVSQGTARKDAIQPVAVRLRISDIQDAARRNQTGSLAPAEFTNHRTASVRMPLPTDDLPPGQYLLTFEASAGDVRTERLVRFEIR